VTVPNERYESRLSVTLILIAGMMSIITSLGAPLVTTVALSDHVSLSTAEWMLTATLLTGALATPIMGRLADGHLQHRVILFALSTVTVGLVLAAVSPNFTWLLIGRSLQGLGLGLVPVCMTIARTHLSPPRAARTIATLSVTVAVGVGLGYPMTSFVAQFVSFHASYWVATGFLLAAFAGAMRILPAHVEGPRQRFDAVGAVSLTLGLTILLIVLGEGQVWGWGSMRSVGSLIASAAILGFWIWFELRTDEPLIDLRQVRRRHVVAADVAGFIVCVAMYLFLPILVEFVTIPLASGYGFGASILMSGLLLVPLSVGTFLASRYVPALATKVQPRAIVPIGTAFFAVASLGFVLFHHHLYEAFIMSGLGGIGAGLTFAAMPGYIVRSVRPHETGGALGFYQLVRNVGLSIGSAVSGLILAHYTPRESQIPTVDGFLTTMKFAVVLLAVAGVVAFIMLSDGPTPELLESPATAVEAGELEGIFLPIDREPTN
jgi:predicted MFS family arabinose efflux permease